MSPRLRVARSLTAAPILRAACLCLGLLFAAAPAGAQENPMNQAVPKSTHGDWQVLCLSDAQTPGECFMAQGLDEEGTGKRVMSVMIMKAADGAPAIRVIVPLGVLLPRGLNVTVDGVDMGDVGFVTCFADGSMTQVAMAPEVISAFKAGNQATVTVYDTREQPIALPLSLSGFTAAFDDF